MNVVMMSTNLAAGQGIKGQIAGAGTRSQEPDGAGSGRDASFANIFDNTRTAQDSDPSADAAVEESESAVEAERASGNVPEAEGGISFAKGSADEAAEDVEFEVFEEYAAAGLALGQIPQQTRDHELIRQYMESAIQNRKQTWPGDIDGDNYSDRQGELLSQVRVDVAGASSQARSILSNIKSPAVETMLNASFEGDSGVLPDGNALLNEDQLRRVASESQILQGRVDDRHIFGRQGELLSQVRVDVAGASSQARSKLSSIKSPAVETMLNASFEGDSGVLPDGNALLNEDQSRRVASESQTVRVVEADRPSIDKFHGMHLAVGQILQAMRPQQPGVQGENLSDEPDAALFDLSKDSQIDVEDRQTVSLKQETEKDRETFSQTNLQAIKNIIENPRAQVAAVEGGRSDSMPQRFEDASGQNGSDYSDIFGKISNPAANAEKPFAVAVQNQAQVLSPEFSILRSQQIVDQVLANSQQIFSQGSGRIKLVLNPPDLGTVDMDVRLLNQKVEVVMVTARAEVQQALQSHADQIKGAFLTQGIQVDSYDVLCFSDSDPRSFEGNAFTDRGSRGDSESRQSLGGETSPKISRQTIQITDDSGISIFA